MIRAIATADNHLNRYYDRMSPQKLSERRRYLRAGFRAAVDDAVAWPAHLFLIGGDLFDTSDPRNQDRSFVADCCARLRAAGVMICAVSGNHDTPRQSTEQGGYAPLDIYRHLGALAYFGEFNSVEEIRLTIDGTVVVVGGLTPDPNWAAEFDPFTALAWHPKQTGADTAILLLHGQVAGYTLPDHEGAVFTKETLRAATDADLIIMGDIHRAREIPLGGGRLLVIPGATERVDFGDAEDVPGYYRLEYAGADWHAERVPLAGQPRRVVTIRAADLPDCDTAPFLIDRVLAVADDQTLVKLTLEGIIPRAKYHTLDLRAVLERLSGRVFHCAIDTRGLYLEDAAAGAVQRGVRLSQRDELAEAARDELARTDDPDERAIIQDALALVLGEGT
jgi:exonuclease SbcD